MGDVKGPSGGWQARGWRAEGMQAAPSKRPTQAAYAPIPPTRHTTLDAVQLDARVPPSHATDLLRAAPLDHIVPIHFVLLASSAAADGRTGRRAGR